MIESILFALVGLAVLGVFAFFGDFLFDAAISLMIYFFLFVVLCLIGQAVIEVFTAITV